LNRAPAEGEKFHQKEASRIFYRSACSREKKEEMAKKKAKKKSAKKVA